MKIIALSLAGVLIVASAPASPAQDIDVAHVKSVLQRYDINADGWLSGNEVNACGCGNFDLDRDAEITLAEFTAGLVMFGEASLAQSAAPGAQTNQSEVNEDLPSHSDGASDLTATFVNEPQGLAGDLAAAFVPFSFDYPSTWKVVESGREPDASNFVKVEREVDGFTAENFAVGHLTLPADFGTDPEALVPVIDALRGMLADGFPNFQPVKTGPAELGGYQGRYLTFLSRVDETPRGPMELWGRALVIPTENNRGVVAMMLATKVGTELRGPGDVAVKGELPVIINSFRFGDAG